MKLNCLLVFLVSIGLIGQTFGQTPAPSAPTMADIQQDFEARKFQDVVKKAIAALQVKAPAASSYDKGQLQLWKAESHLQLKQFIPAADAFTAAAKEAADEKNAGLYRATSLLIRRSINGNYIPKPPAPTPGAPKPKPELISIVEPDSRIKALTALFEDEKRLNAPKIEAASKQSTLPMLMLTIQQIRELRVLEMAATGGDATTKQMLGTIGRRASQLMGDELKRMSQGVEKISKTANSSTSSIQGSPYGGSQAVTIKSGLTSIDQQSLTETIETSKQVVQACEEMGQALGDATPFTKVSTDAGRLATRAEEVLRADYGLATQQLPEGQILQPVSPRGNRRGNR